MFCSIILDSFFQFFLFLFTFFFFFFNDTATTEIYTLSLHDALPISLQSDGRQGHRRGGDDREHARRRQRSGRRPQDVRGQAPRHAAQARARVDRPEGHAVMALDVSRTLAFAQKTWDEEILPTLTEYVRIPAKSPMFDPDWKAHGHLDRAVAMIEQWSRARAIEGLRVEVVRLEGRTPLIFMEVPGRGDDTVLLYGHCDKQPEMVGWGEGLGPWTPARRGGKLYGRGAADDGYAAFAALASIPAP